MTPIGFEDLHPRAASAVISPRRNGKVHCLELCILFTLLLLCYVFVLPILTTSKLLFLLSLTLTSYFTQLLLTTTVVYLKLMLLFLTFCSFILLTEYSPDLLLVNFISGRTIGLCMDVEWWMASNCLPRA